MSTSSILAIDQGTSSNRAIIFDALGRATSSAQYEFAQIYPADGWVEHDPELIFSEICRVCREVLAQSAPPQAIGITNQRETTVVWHRETGECLYNAIVWQDRRTAALCERIRQTGVEPFINERTGLLLDPYFSATKIAWILDNMPGARALAEQGKLAFGTIDSFLIWRLTGGKRHVTDASNASRTLLFNIITQQWDAQLLRIFNIPASMLPEVLDCAADFGTARAEHIGIDLPITGVAGDQQAALIGQSCFKKGMIKSTYGTGCFVVLHTGSKIVRSQHKLLSTVAYRLNGKTKYALEGSIFVAGAAINWLRDGIQLIERAVETERLAKSLNSNNNVYLVPAFTGLGAPHWNPDARGAIFGLTRDTGIAEIARATLESVCYQSADLIQAMQQDGAKIRELRVDGGMVNNDWVMQFLADILNIEVTRPVVSETTALGAAYLAAIGAHIFADVKEVAANWSAQRRFMPQMPPELRQELLTGWSRAVDKVNRD